MIIDLVSLSKKKTTINIVKREHKDAKKVTLTDESFWQQLGHRFDDPNNNTLQ